VTIAAVTVSVVVTVRPPEVAVMIALPAAIPVTTPDAEILAI
jgi:hypothetical protein